MSKALIILGPTAIGKSSLAETFALKYCIPIISADSRQLFQELNIGVAKPKEQTLSVIQHYEIGSISIADENNVAQYCKRVSEHLKTIEGDVIFVGGTGFYIKALLEGLDVLPPKNLALRTYLEKEYEHKGILFLQKKYQEIENPYPIQDTSNPHRLIRAIELGEKTSLKKIAPALKNHEVTLLGLKSTREKLYSRINLRVDQMIQEGLVDEVSRLQNYQHLQALQTVGYREIFSYLNHQCSLQDAIEKIKQHTRNYAKRQLTYFNHQLEVNWFNIEESEKINTFVSNILS